MDHIVSILQALLYLAAVETCVVLPQVFQLQGEVSRGVGVVQQWGSILEGLADLHSVPTRYQYFCVSTVSQYTPLDPGKSEDSVTSVGGGRRQKMGDRHQAG